MPETLWCDWALSISVSALGRIVTLLGSVEANVTKPVYWTFDEQGARRSGKVESVRGREGLTTTQPLFCVARGTTNRRFQPVLTRLCHTFLPAPAERRSDQPQCAVAQDIIKIFVVLK